MTTGGFREVDHELLADYVGGALAGTPDEVTVARLVERDTAWADAYARLAPAVAEVHAALAAYGTAEEMPAGVADQIRTALAATDVATTIEGTPAEGVTAGRAARPSVVPTQPHAGSRRRGGTPRVTAAGPGRRRRRWQRVGAPVALAAVAVAAVGLLGLDQLDRGTDGPGSGTGTTEQAAAGPVGTAGPPIQTGSDYQRADLADPASSPQQFPGESNIESEPSDVGITESEPSGVGIQGYRTAGPVGLDRLTDPSALETCLAAIGTEHDAGRLAVELVDYARFEGRPALVVRFTDATGTRWAWVSGPECGVSGSGADTRYRTRVG
ncbi:hypothetical protein [Salinispora oceanensis]|uniref:hypothetical protein n=1 Tax=Salinispora oceanensis TaxID=1050199 RepID=UPI00036989AD|nr:hypothetical protein [Salinispora oceanensis]